ncbi:valine--tRNA ligase [Candidatus Berkelbacteria bacterium]|nr:valine--tRNA ligase [Candidatus Berkelbacteria bacterium]
MNGLSPTYNPKQVEDKIYKFWEKGNFFKPKIEPKKKPRRGRAPLGRRPFVIALPPPNVTGSLHLGHALNAAAQDILIRRSRMQGVPTLWLPGTDHAGIATQNVVEKDLKKEGKTRFDLGREKFEKRVWQWVDKYGDEIINQLKKLGCSADWSRQRFTLDPAYTTTVERVFKHYFDKGWIYQGERVINWCLRCQTALSDLELEHKKIKAKLYYLKYPFLKKPADFIMVATTRPETMLGDVAVAINPKDKRYQKLIGKKAILPLAGREIPIIKDEAVDPGFGTGAVKVTPAHDSVDFEISERHNLSPLKIMDEEGKIIAPAPQKYQGLKRLAARKIILEDLEKDGFLEKVEDYQTSIPHCSRCDAAIEPLLSKQWFLKMAELKKPAVLVVKKGKIKFVPKNFTKVYLDWMKNLKDWNISRQIWWGHRLPVWQQQTTNNRSREARSGSARQQTTKYYIGDNPPKGYKQVNDVLDTWFSSALWPFAALGWRKQSEKRKAKSEKLSDYDYFFPTTVLSTARDIIFLWVARMIFSSLELTGKIPFSTVYIHPLVLNIKGQRMSKSLGTGIDPLELIEKYGADATRFGLMYQNTGNQDMRFAEEHVVAGRNFANKIWNISRFVLINLENPKPSDASNGSPTKASDKIQNLPRSGISLRETNLKTKADKKILQQLQETIKSVNRDLDGFKFGQAAHTLYDFTWHKLADVYLEKSKEQLNEPALRPSTQQNLLYILASLLSLLHPFVPFVTEEIWAKLPLKDKKSLIVSGWPRE